MTADFAHQVRTPLASAMLYAGQLDTSTPEQAKIASKIKTGLNDLKRMVNDMLGFAAGARHAHDPVNVAELLNNVRDSIVYALRTRTTTSWRCTRHTVINRSVRDVKTSAVTSPTQQWTPLTTQNPYRQQRALVLAQRAPPGHSAVLSERTNQDSNDFF
jgi:signal transduction histidine kinase